MTIGDKGCEYVALFMLLAAPVTFVTSGIITAITSRRATTSTFATTEADSSMRLDLGDAELAHQARVELAP